METPKRKLPTEVLNEISPKKAKLFGKGNLDELCAILRMPILDEIDQILIDKDLTDEERRTYYESSPDIRMVEGMISLLGERISQELNHIADERLRSFVSAVAQSSGGEDAIYKGFQQLFLFVPEVLSKFTVDAYSPTRISQVEDLYLNVSQRMLLHATLELDKLRLGGMCPVRTIDGIQKQLKILFDVGLIGLSKHFLDRRRNVLFAKNYVSLVGANLPKFHAILDNEDVLSVEDMELAFLEADELISSTRDSFVASYESFPFVFVPIPGWRPVHQAEWMAEVAFGLNASVKYSHEGYISSGDALYREPRLTTHLESVVTRHSGDLCIPGTDVPLEIVFQNEPSLQADAASYYLKLKSLFYRKFLEYLRSLPKDRKSVAPASEPVESEQVTFGQGVPERVRFVASKAVAEVGVAGESSGASTPEVSTCDVSFKECKGFRGAEVESILTGILGGPVRTNGSHKFFKSPITGKTLPIAIHEAASVDPRALRDNIRRWGIADGWRRAVKIVELQVVNKVRVQNGLQ